MFTQDSLRRNILPITLGGGALVLMLIAVCVTAFALFAGPFRVAGAPVASRPVSMSTGERTVAPGPVAGPNEDGVVIGEGTDTAAGQDTREGERPVAEGTNGPAPATAVPGGGGTVGRVDAPDAGDSAITSGYWERQRTQDQQAQAFDGYINDTTTVQDTQTGEIHQDLSNNYANPAIESGDATPVATNDLPTSYDSWTSTSGGDTTAATTSSVDTSSAAPAAETSGSE